MAEIELTEADIAAAEEVAAEFADTDRTNSSGREDGLVNLSRVEIMREGGPYPGKGTPEGGAYFDAKRLDDIVANTQRYITELSPPNKLGHSKEQRMAKNTFASDDGIEEDEMPRLGTLAKVYREGKSAYADIVDVPKKMADLIRRRAFPKRSVELGRTAMQSEGGKDSGEVIRALAWLGAKSPAIRTMDDALAFFADEELEPGLVAVDFEEVETDPAAVAELEGMMLAEIVREEARRTVEELSDGATESDNRADTREQMARIELNDEQTLRIFELAGLDPDEDEITGDTLLAGLEELAEVEDSTEVDETPPPNPDPKPPTTPPPTSPPAKLELSEEFQTKLSELEEKAVAGSKAAEDLRVTKRDNFLKEAARKGKIAGGDLDFWREQYDAHEEGTIAVIDKLKEDVELAETFGEDEEGVDPDRISDAQYAQFAEVVGIHNPRSMQREDVD